jgi:AraC family transcriptional regulator, transcriptional activator of pobA
LGDCLLISKGQVQAFFSKDQYKGHLILFSPEFIEDYTSSSALKKINRLYNHHLNQPHYKNVSGNKQFITSLTSELNSDKTYGKSEIVASLITVHLLGLEQQKLVDKTIPVFDRKYMLFESFNRKVEAHYMATRDATSYANFLGISYKHLNEICKEFTGSTAKEFIDEFVLLEAKRKLVTTTLTSRQISHECGFYEPTNFAKYFKKQVGMTPADFREKNQMVMDLP